MTNYATSIWNNRNNTTTGLLAALAAIALAAIGSCLPWAKAPFGSVSGLSGNGLIVIGVGAVAIGFAVWGLKKQALARVATLGLIIPGLIQLVAAFLDYHDMKNGGSGIVKPGMGLYVAMAGGLALIGSGIYVALRGER